jgi:hypothetical protein
MSVVRMCEVATVDFKWWKSLVAGFVDRNKSLNCVINNLLYINGSSSDGIDVMSSLQNDYFHLSPLMFTNEKYVL